MVSEKEITYSTGAINTRDVQKPNEQKIEILVRGKMKFREKGKR